MSTVATLGTSLSILSGASTSTKTTTATTSTTTTATSQAASSASISSTAASSVSSQTSAAISGLSSSSSTESFADVIANTRALLNANEASLAAKGEVLGYGENQSTDAIVNGTFASLDRTALYAVASNSGGQFTEIEQQIAQSLMSKQQGEAMGLYNPANTADPAAEFLAGMKFLNSVSPEEKSSTNWQVSYASLQASYEIVTSSSKSSSISSSSDSSIETVNPVVDLIAKTIVDEQGTNMETNKLSYV